MEKESGRIQRGRCDCLHRGRKRSLELTLRRETCCNTGLMFMKILSDIVNMKVTDTKNR